MPKGNVARLVSSDQPTIYKVTRELKREEHSLFNCLNSIYDDAAFVREISVLYPGLPLVANLRCGLWYTPNPQHTCYFKSTDGHNGNWSFSTTRLNWHIAELAAQRDGCIIVDATRKGKRFPDALSKTIPVWATVINRAIARVRQHDARKALRKRHQNGADLSPVADTQTEVPEHPGITSSSQDSTTCSTCTAAPACHGASHTITLCAAGSTAQSSSSTATGVATGADGPVSADGCSAPRHQHHRHRHHHQQQQQSAPASSPAHSLPYVQQPSSSSVSTSSALPPLLLGPRCRSALLSPQPSLHEWLGEGDNHHSGSTRSPGRLVRRSSSAPHDPSHHTAAGGAATHGPSPLTRIMEMAHTAAVPIVSPQAPAQQPPRSSSLTLNAGGDSLAAAAEESPDPCTPRLGSSDSTSAGGALFGPCNPASSCCVAAAAAVLYQPTTERPAGGLFPVAAPGVRNGSSSSCFYSTGLTEAAVAAAAQAVAGISVGDGAALGSPTTPGSAVHDSGFAFPSPEALAQQAASSASGASPAESPAVGCLPSGAGDALPPETALLPLPCIPVVVLNGTSHQPAVATSILDIWRSADLEELSQLPRLEDITPGVVLPPPLARSSSSGFAGLPPGAQYHSWLCLAGHTGVGIDSSLGWMSGVGGGCAGVSLPSSCPAALLDGLLPDELGLLQGGSMPLLCSPPQGPQGGPWGSSSAAGAAADVAASSTGSSSSVGSGCQDASAATAAAAGGSPSGASPSSSSSWLTSWPAEDPAGQQDQEASSSSPNPDAHAAAAAEEEWDTQLHLPLWVPEQEREQMEARVDGWVEQLLAVGANVRGLAAQLKKPLRPLWVSPSSLIWTNQVAQPSSLPFTPLILVSASQQQQQSQRRPCRLATPSSLHRDGGTAEGAAGAGCSNELSDWSYVYVPGAGDDEESWAGSLAPGVFWERHEELLSAGPQGVLHLVQQLCQHPRGRAPSPSSNSSSSKPSAVAAADAHHPAPLGCVANSGAALEVGGLPGVYYIGSTGMAVGALPPKTSSRSLWAAVDAVLCCSEQLDGQLQQEWQLQQANRELLLPPAAAASPAAPAQPVPCAGRRAGSSGGGGCGGGASSSKRAWSQLSGESLSGSVEGGSPRSRACRQGLAAGRSPPGSAAGLPGGSCMLRGSVGGGSSAAPGFSISSGGCGGRGSSISSGGGRGLSFDSNGCGGRGGRSQGGPAAAGGAGCGSSPRRGGMLSALLHSKAKDHPSATGTCADDSAAGRDNAAAALASSGDSSGGSWSAVAHGVAERAGEQEEVALPQLDDACRPLVAGMQQQEQPGGAMSDTAGPLSAGGVLSAAECGAGLSAALDTGVAAGREGPAARLLWVPVRSSKYERCGLKERLQQMLEFVSGHLAAGRRVLLTDSEGHDTSVCVAVAVLLGCFSDGDVTQQQWPVFLQRWSNLPQCTPVDEVTKQGVRQRLAVVSACYPTARPTRGLLKQVFNFYEGRRRSGLA